MRRPQAQRGQSLIELMVALALGLVISGAAIQLFLANQITVNFQRGMNDVQANGRFAIDQMVRDIRLSGLGPSTGTSSSSTPAVIGLPFQASEIANLATINAGTTALNRDGIATTGAVPGLLQASDQVVVQRIVLGANETDCEGNSVAAGRYIVARYFIRLDNGVPSLACDGGNHSGTALDTTVGRAYGDAGVVLLTGVDSFQVLYGVDDRIMTGGTNNLARIARWMDANSYNALAAPRPTILGVRIGLYLHSQERAGAVDPPPAPIQVLDNAIPVASVPNDGFLRRLFITTVGLRNVSLSGV